MFFRFRLDWENSSVSYHVSCECSCFSSALSLLQYAGKWKRYVFLFLLGFNISFYIQCLYKSIYSQVSHWPVLTHSRCHLMFLNNTSQAKIWTLFQGMNVSLKPSLTIWGNVKTESSIPNSGPYRPPVKMEISIHTWQTGRKICWKTEMRNVRITNCRVKWETNGKRATSRFMLIF